MTHPTKPDRRGPLSTAPAISEEDKARARAILKKHFYVDASGSGLARDIATALAGATAAEREACAGLVETEGRQCLMCGEIRDAIAAAIRSRGEGDANEKG